MATTATLKTISAALELVDTKKQNLKKAFDELLNHPHSSSSLFPFQWAHLDSHFTSTHDSLNQRFHNLQSLESQKTLNDPSPSSPKASNFPSLPTDPSPSSAPIPPNGTVSVLPVTAAETKPHAEALCTFCRNMDGKALRDYIGENLKDKAAIKAALRIALNRAADPAGMVLSAMDGVFIPGGGANVAMDVGVLKKMKRSCNVLFQQLRVVGPNLSSKVRKKAKRLGSEWKGSLMTDNGNGSGGGGDAVGAMAFLHFVAAYGLLSELTVNELATFSAMAAANDELPELYQIIGLTDKVPALVQKLIDRGKHVLAVKYVFEFNLTDTIPPVPILEAYVNESEKLATRLAEEGKSLNEVTARQIHALRSVIKVIENHNLDSEYPRASLEQRIDQLKKQKSNGKQPAFAKKPPKNHLQQSGIKRPRISAPAGPAAVVNNVNSAGSTVHQYQQHLYKSTGLLPEHPNPYMSLPASQFGMVAPAPSISPYQGPSTGAYGLAPMGPSRNPGHSGSHSNPSEPYVPSSYYDGSGTGYGGYGVQHYYHTSYPQ